MDLRQIRYFVTVAERGSFSSAASALNVAQSALSRHVKDLERDLGGALLERGSRGVREDVGCSVQSMILKPRFVQRTANPVAQFGSARLRALLKSSTRRSSKYLRSAFPAFAWN